MSHIMDAGVEKEACDTLKALVQEFGPEAITVSMPKVWFNPEENLGRSRLQFTREDDIEISVCWEGKTIISRLYPLIWS